MGKKVSYRITAKSSKTNKMLLGIRRTKEEAIEEARRQLFHRYSPDFVRIEKMWVDFVS